jgi:hypothetical protein
MHCSAVLCLMSVSMLVAQVQTLSGEGVLTRWQRLLRAAGVRRYVALLA